MVRLPALFCVVSFTRVCVIAAAVVTYKTKHKLAKQSYKTTVPSTFHNKFRVQKFPQINHSDFEFFFRDDAHVSFRREKERRLQVEYFCIIFQLVSQEPPIKTQLVTSRPPQQTSDLEGRRMFSRAETKAQQCCIQISCIQFSHKNICWGSHSPSRTALVVVETEHTPTPMRYYFMGSQEFEDPDDCHMQSDFKPHQSLLFFGANSRAHFTFSLAAALQCSDAS